MARKLTPRERRRLKKQYDATRRALAALAEAQAALLALAALDPADVPADPRMSQATDWQLIATAAGAVLFTIDAGVAAIGGEAPSSCYPLVGSQT